MSKKLLFCFVVLVVTFVITEAILPLNYKQNLYSIQKSNDTLPQVKVSKTSPLILQDLTPSSKDLKTPENLQQETIYNPKTNTYSLGVKFGDSFLNTPFLLTPEQYKTWSLHKSMQTYFKTKNRKSFEDKGKKEFDFTDLNFSLGPAEKIFGPGGVRIRTQGSVELKIGANSQTIDNPSLPLNRRNTFGFDFDEKINLNLTGSIGDKMNLNLNYNTEATFDFDTKDIKLKYEGKEDDIVKLVEAGNVSLPSNSALIRGSSSLFGFRTDLQFGKLKLQTVLSQKKTSSSIVNSRGGKQLVNFEFSADNYESNRHFFLAHYFRDHYDEAFNSLPQIISNTQIGRIEVWVTNNNGVTTNTRNIISLTDLGESNHLSNPIWTKSSQAFPANQANNLYTTLNENFPQARYIDQTTQVLGTISHFIGEKDFEKLESAKLLNSSEYTINRSLGYISLKFPLQADQVLCVAFEYTYRGQTYQVGEFSTDQPDNQKALLVKTLKSTNNTPQAPTWNLMMKNIYALGTTSLQKEGFKLNIKYLNDTTGVYLNYINNPSLKSTPLIRLLGFDQIDNQNNPYANGLYDFIDGYTIDTSTGRIILPRVEPFGSNLIRVINNPSLSSEYAYTSLYDSLLIIAKQDAEHDKFLLSGEYRGSNSNEIQLNAFNIPRGSVIVTANGVPLIENSDYTVDYNMGVVTILNQSLIDAGTNINVSLESVSDFSLQRKTMFGVNWQYDLSKQLTFGGTFMNLSEQPLISKVAMGEEAVNNMLWGANISWKKRSQWLTDLIDKLPFIEVTAPSQINFTAEFANLIAGNKTGNLNKSSYLDDFENTNTKISISSPTEWVISSCPLLFNEANLSNDLGYGFNRALLSWYNVDPILTRRNSSLTPGHLKSDLTQQSNHYIREVYKRELFPNTQTTYGEPTTLSVLNLSYYPHLRGPYNLDPNLTTEGFLSNPKFRWGGMMRKLDNTDFETSNIAYIEFWMLDPFIYSKKENKDLSGTLYFNLGEISEDILSDRQKFSESDMPLNGDIAQTKETLWGRMPIYKGTTYAFNTENNAREHQDVGYNGLRSKDEKNFTTYINYLNQIKSKVSPEVFDSISQDPAGDDFHYFRGSDYDQKQYSILERYKRINMPEGNSVDANHSPEKYNTTYKNTPDVEDINSDYTLNEYNRYYQYKISIHPDSLQIGKNFIVDERNASVTLRNNTTEQVTWYLFRIPLEDYQEKIGNIQNFNNIRFMRMFLTDFSQPVTLRLATLDLVRGEWRTYDRPLNTSATSTGSLTASSVNYEENSGKIPVNYVLPPGISRVVDPSQRQMLEQNEAALSLVVKDLGANDAKAVYKRTNLDLRNYKRLLMFSHANALMDGTELNNKDISIFLRLGSDYTNNYYEYEIPLEVTPKGEYNTQSIAGSKAVWPQSNELNVALSLFTQLKKERNKQKSLGNASYSTPFFMYDPHHQNNKVTIVGNPSLGEIRTLMIGVKNNTAIQKSAEVWANELRLQEYENAGGWAAQGTLNIQLSDLATINLSGQYESSGFGGIEDNISQRSQEDLLRYNVTTNIDLGRLTPPVLKLQAPLYYSYSKEKISPLYNPLDTDLKLKDAEEALQTQQEKDSLNSLVTTNITQKNFSLSNIRFNIATKNTPMPYDPANISFSYAHNQRIKTGSITVWETDDNWRWLLTYQYNPNFKPLRLFKPFKWAKKSPYLRVLDFHFAPQTLSVHSELNRHYYELQERDLDNLSQANETPLIFNSTFLWNRRFNVRWDLTNNLKISFSSATNAEVEMPYTPVNADLYPDRYTAWKDSVWRSILTFGTPLTYQQTFNSSYKIPYNIFPFLNWITTEVTYNSSYNWTRGYTYNKSINLGNTIANSRDITGNTKINFETLYKHLPFFKQTINRFNRSFSDKEKSKPKVFEKEIKLQADTTFVWEHNQKNKRVKLKAVDQQGKSYPLRYRVIDANKVMILNKDTLSLKVTLLSLPKIEDQSWYKLVQNATNFLLMLRSVDINYTQTNNLSLPGFLPTVGNVFGQRKGVGGLQPGLAFAFGLTDETFIEKAKQKGYLLLSDSISTPAVSNASENLQIKATLKPFRSCDIYLNTTRIVNRANTLQFMYDGTPSTQTGSFTMTTLSIHTAFASKGTASNNYYSKYFADFLSKLPFYQKQFEQRFLHTSYPQGTPLAGKSFSPSNGSVSPYANEVLIPAFLSTYTVWSPKAGEFFPTLMMFVPNWSLRYSGLSKYPTMQKIFKSFNLNHSYKSIYAVGAYGTYANFRAFQGDLGFITDVSTNLPIPSSRFDISNVSINETFSPLFGVDMTFKNNLTTKVEYRKSRMLTLSTASYQITEAHSNDFVLGIGYTVNDFKLLNYLFDGNNKRKRTKQKNKSLNEENNEELSSSGFNNTLTLQADISWKSQNTINRNITTQLSNATTGNSAFKMSFTASYVLNRLMTLNAYYERQQNTPLLTANSYPTAMQDFGITFRFSLTR